MASIEKRARDGRTIWRAHYRTPAGTQRNKTFTRKVDAERFLATVENAKNTGSFVDPALARVTFGTWAQQWLNGQTHVKPTTFNRYEGALRKHILPTWSHVKLSAVSHADVQVWITKLTETQSPASVRKIHRVLSLVLDMAIRDGRLNRNVADDDLARHITGKDSEDLVFGGIRGGKALRVSVFRKPFSAAAAAIGIPGLHPHELRHTAASLAIASGADIKVVQQMLGNDDPRHLRTPV